MNALVEVPTLTAELARANPGRMPNESGDYRTDRAALIVEEI